MIVNHLFVEAESEVIISILQRWKNEWPFMTILALLPEAEKSQVTLLQNVCSSLNVIVHGAIFPALLDGNGFRISGVLLICLGNAHGAFLIEDIQQDGAERMKSEIEGLMQQAPAVDGSRGTLFTIFDAMLPNIGTLLDNTHVSLERTPRYIGVNAGSETFQPMPCLFDNARLIQNGVLGIYFPRAMKWAVHHAYEQSTSQWRATSATGNRIVTIEDRPAFEVYQEIIWEQYQVRLNKENFYDYAVHFPFGLVTAVDILVRIPVGLGEDDSIFCVGEIAPDSMLRLLKAPALKDSSCAHDIGLALQPDGPAPTVDSILTFYCAGRRMHFGADAVTEISQIQESMLQADVFGALSLGEIDTLEYLDYPRFHNAAVVCIAS
jgi:hypothetical protein